MHWNYRVVFMEDDKWGDQWHELREVFYNEKGEPVGHSGTTVMGADVAEVIECLEKMLKDIKEKAVMNPKDFSGTFTDLDEQGKEFK